MQKYDRYATLCMNVCLFSHVFDQVHPNLGSCFGLCMSRCLLEPLHVFAVWQNLVAALLHDFATDFLAFRVPYDLRSLGSVSFISMIQRSPCLSLKQVIQVRFPNGNQKCFGWTKTRRTRTPTNLTTILSVPSQTWSQEASSSWRILQRH